MQRTLRPRLTLGYVDKQQYVDRIRGPISLDKIPQIDDPFDDPPRDEWVRWCGEGIDVLMWIQSGDPEWLIGMTVEGLPDKPHENPPSADRLVFYYGEYPVYENAVPADEIPKQVANASLAALPHAGLLGLPTWAWVAGGVGLVTVVGVVMATRR